MVLPRLFRTAGIMSLLAAALCAGAQARQIDVAVGESV
ncbi:copper-binding periplasmic protein [Brucella neotomae]|nr:hypothetical protein DK64_548 [Brucella neotomae 5K33]SPU67468.1 copper-binding periplasmic protein [Brucella neotomae]SPU68346.1 copper-binding periplasmic protein [Brucella neotomae]SUW61348.1 copper-binding periplasmic protein [Brucella neotomae]